MFLRWSISTNMTVSASILIPIRFELVVFNLFYSFQKRRFKFCLYFFWSRIFMTLSRLTDFVFIPFSIKSASLESSIYSVSIDFALAPVFFARLSQNFTSAAFSTSIIIASISLNFTQIYKIVNKPNSCISTWPLHDYCVNAFLRFFVSSQNP